MLSDKSLIEHIKKQNSEYNSPESAMNQANALDTLSTDIYSDDKRFVFELLQNADDASCSSGFLDIQINISSNFVVISHRGEAFSNIDIESICSIGDGNKQGDENKTGFKGIGFKSVFSHSNYVIIYSGQKCFRFDKDFWKEKWFSNWGNENNWKNKRKEKNKSSDVKMPWQIIPIPSNLPLEFSNFYNSDFTVSTFIKLNDTTKVERELKELFSDTQILLFLRSPEVRLKVKKEDKNILFLEKVNSQGVVNIKKNGKIQSEWLIRSFDFRVDELIKSKIANDNRIPKKLREANRTEISFAIQLEKNKIKKVEKNNRLIFTYLPTSVNYDFPFLVNASFLTDAGRQYLHEDWSWNQWLFKQIPIKFFIWVAELAENTSNYKYQFLSVIPPKLSAINDLRKNFNEGYQFAIETIAFIPNMRGDLLKVSEALFDKSNISDFLKKKTLLQYINQKKDTAYSKRSFIPQFKNESVLKRLGVDFFDFGDLEDFFQSKIFQENHQLEENFDLINFLFEKTGNLSGEEKQRWLHVLRTLPFIFAENNNLVCPKLVYFPSEEFSENLKSDIKIIHSDIIQKINSHQKIKRWLISLGVKEPSDVSFIEKTILYDDDYVTKKNAISVGRYLFNAHKKNLLEDWHYSGLKKLKILTKEKRLVTSENAFLSNYYEPELRLENVYKNDFYTSDKYLEGNELKSEWKTFFLKIGVNESIEVQQIKVSQSKDFNKIELQYFLDAGKEAKEGHGYPHLVGSHNSINIDKVTYSEFARNDITFSKMFWEKVFEKVNPNYINKKSWMPWGYFGSSTGVTNYFHWSLENSRFIPTTTGRCLRAPEVFVNKTEIKEVAGKYLPVFDFEGSIPSDWLGFLPFRQSLSLNNYLDILSAIWKDDLTEDEQKKANKKRIELIYKKLAEDFLGYSEELRTWGKSNKLLAKGGKKFFSPSKLSIVTAEGFQAENLAFCDEKDERIVKLLKKFGVSIIDNVEAKIPNSQTEIQDLKKQLLHILPLIAVLSVEKSRSKKDWELEYKRLNRKLKHIRFFQTSEIYLSYGNEEDKQKRSSWADNNSFYYVGNWYKPRILDSLVEPLGKFLGIRYAERHLSVLLLDDFIEGLEYLKEKFGEEAIKIIPKHLLNPQKPTNITRRTGGGYTESKADLGRKGELFVYNSLKEIYKEKYQCEIEETKTGFRIKENLEVIWSNMGGIESGKNYDFVIIEGDNRIYIESKATPFGEETENIDFELTVNEFRLMKTATKYLVARVFNVTTNPKMKLIKMKLSKLN